ncbi:MAG: YihY/virulence factor BrkB family protein [Nitrolancea sp.]
MREAPHRLYAFGKGMFNEIRHDDVSGLAAEVAFRLLFSLPALAIFFAALSAQVARYTGVDAFSYLQKQVSTPAIPLPVRNSLDLVLKAAKDGGHSGVLSIGILLSLWSASSAVGTLIKAFNRAYDVEETRNFVWRRVMALGLTLGLSLLMLVSFLLVLVGQRLGEEMAAEVGLGNQFTQAWNIGRWPLIFILFMIALAVLYWAGPSQDLPLRWLSPGAVIATLLWIGASWTFSLYLRLVDVGNAYGVLGAVVVLLFFLWISSIVLIVGAETNVVADRVFGNHERELIPAARSEPAPLPRPSSHHEPTT